MFVPITLNKYMIEEHGLECAYVYQTLETIGQGEKIFPVSLEQLEKETGYNARQQKRILDKLETAGLIEVSIKGFPPKRHISL